MVKFKRWRSFFSLCIAEKKHIDCWTISNHTCFPLRSPCFMVISSFLMLKSQCSLVESTFFMVKSHVFLVRARCSLLKIRTTLVRRSVLLGTKSERWAKRLPISRISWSNCPSLSWQVNISRVFWGESRYTCYYLYAPISWPFNKHIGGSTKALCSLDSELSEGF